MTHKIYSAKGDARTLGELIGEGGQGAVYQLEDSPKIVVKLFHPARLEKDGESLRQKIAALAKYDKFWKEPGLAWPRMLVYDKEGKWIGYAMRKVSGVPLNRLAHPMLHREYFPGLNRIKIVQMLLNLTAIVESLHQNDIYIGDLNMENVLCNPQTMSVHIIDNDSFQVKSDGRLYPCPVGRPEMTPPEHHNVDFTKIVRNASSDVFSLAILFFQCLMLGRHPFDNVGGESPAKNMKNGRFPYGTEGAAPGRDGAVPPGPWYTIWSHLTFQMKTLFIAMFKEGIRNIHARPTLKEWQGVLRQYLYHMREGHHAIDLIPAKPKSQARVQS
ncbi:MAG: hypothetical protein Kow0037_31000 [Calditrichia bacterium]